MARGACPAGAERRVLAPCRSITAVLKKVSVTDLSTACYTHLGPFSGLVAAAKAVRPLFGQAPIVGPESRRRAKESFAFTIADEQPRDIRSGRSWTADGVRGEEISWSVGFGPRTEGFVLKPLESEGRLPGVVALHDHGHFKFFGKEKIADGLNGCPRRSAVSGRPIMAAAPTPTTGTSGSCV
jgi:hypothetical protein